MTTYGSPSWVPPHGLPEPGAPGDGVEDGRITAARFAIESDLFGPLDIDALAAQAGLSRWHFMHLFRKRTGESLAGYQGRLRVEYGAMRLRWGEERVGKVAAASGFGSQAAFTRAFAARFGITPARFRNKDPRWPVEMEPETAPITIHRRPELVCLAARFHGAYFDAPLRWARFLERLPPSLRPVGDGSRLDVAVNHDDPGILPPELLRHTLCVVLPEGWRGDARALRKAGLAAYTIAGGLYAAIAWQGPYPDIHHAYRGFYTRWRLAERYRLTDTPPIELWRAPPLSLGEVACAVLAGVTPAENPAKNLS